MITLCIAFHVYFGPVTHTTYAIETHRECSTVTKQRARAEWLACAQQGAERCEVILAGPIVQIERKEQAQ